jgi:polyhydroxybutyrate depolymerase
MTRRRAAHLIAFAGALVVVVIALGAAFDASSTPASPPPPAPLAQGCAGAPGTTTRITTDVPGQGTRSAVLHMPRARRGRVPLVMALHGQGGTGAFMEQYSGLSRNADRSGFAVVYPDSVGPRWKIAAGEGDSDVDFLEVLIDRLVAAGCFDPDRVSVVGVSNGGGMAARLACDDDGRLAALVSVAGSYRTLPDCQRRRPLSVLEIHGTRDTVVPYWGDARSDIVGWVRRWAARDRCARSAARTYPARNVQRLDWPRCRGGAAVTHLRLMGGVHTWPGANKTDPPADRQVSASDETWKFLAGQRRAKR